MNAEAVAQRKPIVECAMYDLEATITSITPGQTPCLACLTPEPPPAWTRQFPVFGAVSGTVGCMEAMEAMEAIKIIAGFGKPLLGKMVRIDLRDMTFDIFNLARNPNCAVCGGF